MARQVVFLPEFIDCLDALSLKLYESDYFGFKDSAKRYTDKILIYTNKYVGIIPDKAAPRHFDHFGKNMRYITYHPNKQTAWYVFFQQNNNKYLIRYLSNNHVAAQYMIDE